MPDGTPYGTVVGVYDYGAGFVCDIEKLNKKIEMLPLDSRFIQMGENNQLVVQPFEFTEVKPVKES